MSTKIAMQVADVILFFGYMGLLALMVYRKSVRKFWPLFSLVAVRAAMVSVTITLLFHRQVFGFSREAAYNAYFYSYWASAALALALQVVTIYCVYRIAMKPLDGLRRIGKVIFRWVASVSVVLSSVLVFGPHVQDANRFATMLGQVQEGVSVLTICLLLFVCFAIRPLGLTYRSRLFGITLGLGITSCIGLVMSTWLTTETAQSLYSPIFLVAICGAIASMLVWTGYFAAPEPERKMILLPTTSPYFLWNRISEALGDEPGVVAIAGFTPAMLAPAEMAAIGAMNHSLPRPEFVEDAMPPRLALSR